jgi:hypothetical protein
MFYTSKASPISVDPVLPKPSHNYFSLTVNNLHNIHPVSFLYANKVDIFSTSKDSNKL